MDDNQKTVTYKATADTIEASEAGRKYSDPPEILLIHLLNIGWAKNSSVIRRTIERHGLQEYYGWIEKYYA